MNITINFSNSGKATVAQGKLPPSVVKRVTQAAYKHWLLDPKKASNPYGRVACIQFQYNLKSGRIQTGNDENWINVTLSGWDNQEVAVQL